MATTFKTSGIVLRTLKYSDNSVIVDIYTQKKGLRSFIVSGLNQKKGKSKSAVFRHLNIIDFVGYDKPDGSLGRIKEQKLKYHFTSLTYDIRKSSVGLFILELTRNCIQEAEENEALYTFLENTIVDLDRNSDGINEIPLKFTIDLTNFIGITPNNNWSSEDCYFSPLEGIFTTEEATSNLTKETSLQLNNALEGKIDTLSKMSKNNLLDEMLKYYAIHLEKFKALNTLKVYRDLF